MSYKYLDERTRAPSLARLLASLVHRHHLWFEEYDVITAMPAYIGPDARRGWDPVRSLVLELSEQLGDGWDVRTDLVVKTAETDAMSGRSLWERNRIAQGQLRRALRPGPGGLDGARILVVDDVFTEGSTLREVSRVLRLAGAEEVAGLVLGRPPLGAPAYSRPRVVPDR